MTLLFDVLFAPLATAPGWLSLAICAGIFALMGLLVYRFSSNQAAIRRTKSGIKAELLAIKLFRDEPRVIFGALGSIILGSVVLLRHALVPLVIMFAPFVLIIAQLAMRYQWQPIHVGDSVLVTVDFDESVDVVADGPTLDVGVGFVVDAPPVRIPAEHRVVWRVRANEVGRREWHIGLGDVVASKAITVGNTFERICPQRVRSGFWDRILFPAEPPLNQMSRITRITIDYPSRESWLSGANVWVLWLVGFSYVWALLLKRWMRVEF